MAKKEIPQGELYPETDIPRGLKSVGDGCFLSDSGQLFSLENDIHTGQRFLKLHSIKE